MNLYGLFAKLARFVYRLFIRTDIVGTMPADDEPAVFVVHHQNLSGPIHALLTLPKHAHLWVYRVFFDRKECYLQYSEYTFSKRFGFPKVIAKVCAGLLALIVPSIMRSFSAIPVYRGSRDIVKTFDISLSAMLQGESVIIAPDIDYDSSADEMGDIYTGFLHIEKMFFKKTGRHLSFVPLAYNTHKHSLAIGNAIRFDDESSFAEQRALVALKLKDAINSLEMV